MRINMLVPIFPGMARPNLRKEVVKELNEKKTIQDTIKRIFLNKAAQAAEKVE